MQKDFNWAKLGTIGVGILAIGAIGAPFIANDNVDTLQTQIDALNEKIQVDDEGNIVNLAEIEVIVDEEAATTQDVYDRLVEDDMFETEAETLVMEEIEDDDYEELYEFMTELGLDIDDKDDITNVNIEDVDMFKVDVDSRDVKRVKIDLKVYYEDRSGHGKHEHVRVTAEIDDNEVDGDLRFSRINQN